VIEGSGTPWEAEKAAADALARSLVRVDA
jgi:hypothetical protein